MKKVLIFICAVLLVLPASAQLHVKQTPKDEKVLTLRMGYVTLYQSEGRFALLLSTTNRYDKLFPLFLGYNKESASQTMADLLAFFDSDEKEITFTNLNEDCYAYKSLGQINFKQRGFAAAAPLSKAEMKRIKEAIDEYGRK